MNFVALDTLAIARKLQAAGFSDVQAEAVTGVLRDARDSDLSNLVTKGDFGSEIGSMGSGLRAEIALVRSELKSEIGLVRSDLRTKIADTRFEILKWVLSAIGFQTIVVVGAVVALTKGLH